MYAYSHTRDLRMFRPMWRVFYAISVCQHDKMRNTETEGTNWLKSMHSSEYKCDFFKQNVPVFTVVLYLYYLLGLLFKR
jgi:hypothetical protein